ncbi:MAG: hypothetical protein EBY66_00575 [Candidatus Fonsibacter lacus]|nr:hypothetical protein [Candidatus Fonsibacter lacus]
MTQEYPITPPPELIRKWNLDAVDAPMADKRYIATQAARWGADQELEACCEWLKVKHWVEPEFADELRAARRPKPPSLKELALMALEDAVKMADDTPPEGICSDQANIIRRALEQLDD